MNDLMIPDTKNLQEEGSALLTQARAIIVTNEEEYKAAGLLRLKVMSAIKRVEDFFSPIIKQADKLHKDTIARKVEVLFVPRQAIGIIDSAMLPWASEQLRIRREAEEKIRREKEEAERKKREEEEKLLAEAKVLEDAGQAGEAEKKLRIGLAEIKKEVPKIEKLPEKPFSAGATLRQYKRWRVVDETAIPREYLKPDDRKIDEAVNRVKDDPGIPGIEIYWDERMAGTKL